MKGYFSMRITRTSRYLLPVLATGALFLAGCGASDPAVPTSAAGAPSATATTAAAAAQNDSDVTFATGMIPHHGQAVEMADLALENAESPKIKELATQIKAAQAPEIATLSELLREWGEPVPEAAGHSSSMEGMEHGDSGMMSAEQMDELKAAQGAEFDQIWLEMMIAHHEGAVAVSTKAISSGTDPAARKLAEEIVTTQSLEITELKSLLTELS